MNISFASYSKQTQPPKPRLGISACILGSNVRHNGGNCRDRFVLEELSRFFDWVSICPEVEMGMSVPRESIRVVQKGAGDRLIGNKSKTDYTPMMQRWQEHKLAILGRMKLHGFILKKGSPSCGMERVSIYNEKGNMARKGAGLFASALKARFPLMPMEEEGRLNDMRLRETFMESVYAYQRWLELTESDPKPHDLVRFHTEHKFQLLAHDEPVFRELGRLVAQAGTRPMGELLAAYGPKFMDAIRQPVGQKAHANVLYHLLGFLKRNLDGADKRELTSLIDGYRRSKHPINVPLTLFKHHFRKFPNEWVAAQRYLTPYPAEFAMRSRV